MMNLIMFMLLSMTGLISFSVLNVAAPKYAPQPTPGTETAKVDKPRFF